MGKRVLHIAEDAATGRLFYRRAFPEPLRQFLEKPRRELKVPLGARGHLTGPAMRQWDIDNPRHKLGSYGYALEDYGWSVEKVEAAYGPIAKAWKGR